MRHSQVIEVASMLGSLVDFPRSLPELRVLLAPVEACLLDRGEVVAVFLILDLHIGHHILQFLLLLVCQVAIIHGVHDPHIAGSSLTRYSSQTFTHPIVLILDLAVCSDRGRHLIGKTLLPRRGRAIANILIGIAIHDDVPGYHKLLGSVLSPLQETA
jgi:hypothetical protein